MDKKTEQEKLEKEIAIFNKNQSLCSHKGNFLPLGQQTMPDGITRKLVLLNTVICGHCGKQFFQTIITSITISSVQSPIMR